VSTTGSFVRGKEQDLAKMGRGIAQSGLMTSFALLTVGVANWVGWDVPGYLATIWTGFLISLGNALGRFYRSKIGHAFEGWIVRRLENGQKE
jgi:hypothetical protein